MCTRRGGISVANIGQNRPRKYRLCTHLGAPTKVTCLHKKRCSQLDDARLARRWIESVELLPGGVRLVIAHPRAFNYLPAYQQSTYGFRTEPAIQARYCASPLSRLSTMNSGKIGRASCRERV